MGEVSRKAEAGASRDRSADLLLRLYAATDPAPGWIGLANLVAYRSLVESTREWPFGLPAQARFALFAAIGAGSWVGGALVERLLGAARD